MVVKKQSTLHVDTRSPINPEEVTGKPTSITSRKDEPLPAVIRDTFNSARRQLQKFVERQQGKVKTHPLNEVTAFVDRIFPAEGYGFLRSLDGEQIYFHKNSTLHGEWERLEVGTGVRYTPQEGDKGLQASSVEIVNKPGAREMHDTLHDLPEVTKPNRKNKI